MSTRLIPPKTSPPSGGIRQRVPTYLVVSAAGFLASLLSMASQFLNVRILSAYLGTEYYAAYSVLASLSAWFLLADLGVSTSLQNSISHSRAAEKPSDDLIVTGLSVLLCISFLLSCLWLLLGEQVSGFFLGGIPALHDAERTFAFLLFALFMTVSAAAQGIQRVWLAEHRGYLGHLSNGIAAGLGTIAAWVVLQGGAERSLALAVTCIQAPLAILQLAALLKRWGQGLRRGTARIHLAGRLIANGASFFSFQAAAAAVLAVDYVIISWTLSAQDVVVYSIAHKVFIAAFTFYGIILSALWPVCAEAISKGDQHNIEKIILKFIILGVFSIFIVALIFIYVSTIVCDILVPDIDISIPSSLIVMFAVYFSIRVWTDTWSMVILARGRLLILLVAVPIQALLSICLQYFGARNFGLVGSVAGLSLSFLLTVAWLLPAAVKRTRNT